MMTIDEIIDATTAVHEAAHSVIGYYTQAELGAVSIDSARFEDKRLAGKARATSRTLAQHEFLRLAGDMAADRWPYRAGWQWELYAVPYGETVPEVGDEHFSGRAKHNDHETIPGTSADITSAVTSELEKLLSDPLIIGDIRRLASHLLYHRSIDGPTVRAIIESE